MLLTVGSKIGECDNADNLGWGTEVLGLLVQRLASSEENWYVHACMALSDLLPWLINPCSCTADTARGDDPHRIRGTNGRLVSTSAWFTEDTTLGPIKAPALVLLLHVPHTKHHVSQRLELLRRLFLEKCTVHLRAKTMETIVFFQILEKQQSLQISNIQKMYRERGGVKEAV